MAPRYLEEIAERGYDLWVFWKGYIMGDPDDLDGLCDEDQQPDPTPDEDIDGIVLFADLAGTQDLEEIQYRKAEWEALFSGS